MHLLMAGFSNKPPNVVIRITAIKVRLIFRDERIYMQNIDTPRAKVERESTVEKELMKKLEKCKTWRKSSFLP